MWFRHNIRQNEVHAFHSCKQGLNTCKLVVVLYLLGWKSSVKRRFEGMSYYEWEVYTATGTDERDSGKERGNL